MKKFKIFSLIAFVISRLSLIVLAFFNAFSKDIIGGVGIPSFLFSFRQVMCSAVGIILSAVGVVSLILFFFIRKND